ncbi:MULTISPECIES: IucA/IucC family C-terminal-domain containing protein [Streptomyces]|uniref:IucA/IucC family C-terminal-domain containing protein n=1 Tax=Streptomyces TaxID=1883 RepID=UPI00163C9B39|nr:MULTISPECIES: IucA/IucC family C-terminal-domain containing protein [Streptomyces]MBC2878146.1 IucA/IucC family siderophore biosynthesis protein [Streptomyces sp. TYQ1024]UBI39647.1 IucA/IucC family siderophore biosynthesis protein [Streptomyces mobaraensis]UKW32224.1 IucA/IucC family siderophore biosynthesis protein [Streptomyces sp. TYQ1024]
MSGRPRGGDVESRLVVRVLDALLREDVCRLRGTARAVSRPDGEWLALTVDGETILLPVAPDGPGGAARVRAPLLETAGGPVTGLHAILARLRPATDPRERAGFDALTAACATELAALRLRERTDEDVTERLAAVYGRSAAAWTGPRGALAYDALAARRPDPDPPTVRSRTGELTVYEPEFHPCFGLRWVALPRTAVHRGPGEPPPWWPAPDALGLPELTATHTMLPVHPLTAGPPLARALRATGLDGAARFAEKPWADVVPARSAGVLALVDAPEYRLELPLPASASAGPATLADGVVTQRLVEEVLLCEPGFVGSVLPAAADTCLYAGHPLLTVRVRHDPCTPADAHVVPVAALAARTPDGEPVARALARRYYGGSARSFADAYLTLLLDWCTTLFSYGVALETHPRDLALVLDEHRGRTRLRLLYRDHARPRVNGVRLASRLGGEAADLLGFADRGILAGHDGPVADLLAAGALRRCAVEPLSALTGTDRADGLRLLRDRLDDALHRLPPGAAAVLRTRLLDAGRLPVRAVLTPLLRPGASEYVNVPNYLWGPMC